MRESKLKYPLPITASLRGTVLLDRGVCKVEPEKKLTVGKHSSGGRDHHGHTSVRYRGGGHKRKYRLINFQKVVRDAIAVVKTIEYDPNRTANIALIEYENGNKEYMIASSQTTIGDKIQTSTKADIIPGNTLPLFNIPVGTNIYNIELKKNGGAKLVRSAGTYAVLQGKEGGQAIVKLPSGESRVINSECLATIGIVSNVLHQNIKIGKAGRNRWLGRRPAVRGVAKNPVDHPMGGGNGKTSGGRDPVSPWGQKAKGLKTRNNKRTEKFIITKRNKK